MADKALHKTTCLCLFIQWWPTQTGRLWLRNSFPNSPSPLYFWSLLEESHRPMRRRERPWEANTGPSSSKSSSCNRNQPDWPLTITGSAGRTKDGICSSVTRTCFLFSDNQGVSCVVLLCTITDQGWPSMINRWLDVPRAQLSCTVCLCVCTLPLLFNGPGILANGRCMI